MPHCVFFSRREGEGRGSQGGLKRSRPVLAKLAQNGIGLNKSGLNKSGLMWKNSVGLKRFGLNRSLLGRGPGRRRGRRGTTSDRTRKTLALHATHTQTLLSLPSHLSQGEFRGILFPFLGSGTIPGRKENWQSSTSSLLHTSESVQKRPRW